MLMSVRCLCTWSHQQGLQHQAELCTTAREPDTPCCRRCTQVWECRSKLARSLIARRCIFTYSGTLAAWLRLALLCVLCCLGLWGVHCSVLRPAVEAHIAARRERRRQEELARVKGLMERLRGEARTGQQHLQAAKQEWQRHTHKVRHRVRHTGYMKVRHGKVRSSGLQGRCGPCNARE
jgi:hypothetical protein